MRPAAYLPLPALVLLASLTLGCDAGEDDVDNPFDTGPPDPTPCGEPMRDQEMTIQGMVVGAGRNGATVELRDHRFRPARVLGSTTATPSGSFLLVGRGITTYEDCWLTLLDYRIAAEAEDGTEAERVILREMYGAFTEGLDTLDLSDDPLLLE